MQHRAMGTACRACFIVLAAVAMSGCIASTRNPERLFPVSYEMEQVRLGQEELIRQYWALLPTNSSGARAVRNEIITQRMYAIDVQYTQYETALTREIQEVGFGSLTTAGGLTTAATLVASAGAKTILSALATAILNTKGHYESQLLLAQTMRAIQKQMRLSRNNVAITIAGKMALSVADYPLWAALSDLEDYYQAGTLTSGVIDISTTVGIQESESKGTKDSVTMAPAGERRSMIIESPSAPIPRPIRNPRVDDGIRIGDFEKQIQAPEIREIQAYLCLTPNGRFTKELRDTLIRRLGVNKRAPVDRILRADGDFVSDEILAGKKRC